MKTTLMITILVLGSPIFAADHSHHQAPAAIKLDHNKKWATDAALRKGMDAINQLIRESFPGVRDGKINDRALSKLGTEMKEQTDYVFKNCKLAPQADQELHKILIKIMSAQQVLTGKEKAAAKHEAFDSVVTALNEYGNYFEHDGWAPAK